MKVKDDHRSKFSNLSNWKEEAWKKKILNLHFTDFFFTSCGSLIPFTRANAQWVIHGLN